MKTVRFLLLTLLTLAILPWGAYATAFAATTTIAVPKASSLDQLQTAPGGRAAIRADSPMKIFAKRKCRTANLPGSACGPDILLQFAKITTYWSEEARSAPMPSRDWFTQGLTHAPPGEPPRPF